MRKDEPLPRKEHPDYVADPDHGSSSSSVKNLDLVDADEHQHRANDRAGLRDLDRMTERAANLTRAQKERARIFPRETNADLRHPRMRRKLPDPGVMREPLSARQRNARSKIRRETQDRVPLTQLRAQRDLVTRPQRWRELNDQLSDQTGDIKALPERDQEQIRRVDRAIQSYERRNERGHLLYSNVRLPHYINQGNVAGFVQNNFGQGTRLAFDRYTQATHQLHETASHVHDPDGRVVVFEMETRRGAYLGQSDKRDNTQHLLPRGMEFEVVAVRRAAFVDPNGTRGSRIVVQLRDIT